MKLFKVKGNYTESKSVTVEVGCINMIKSIQSYLLGSYRGDPKYINSDGYICHEEDGYHDWVEVVDDKNPSTELVEAYKALMTLKKYLCHSEETKNEKQN